MGITVTLDQVDTIDPPAGDPLVSWFRFRVLIQPLTGSSAYGEQVTDPFGVWAWIEDKLVRSPDGSTVTSETHVYLPINTPDVPQGSQVRLPVEFGSREGTVTTAARYLGGGQTVPQHLELVVT